MAHNKKKDKKKYSEQYQSDSVMVSRIELDKLRQLAKERADETETLDDDEFIDNFDEYVSDMGDSVDEKDDRRWELEESPIIDKVRHELRRELLNSEGRWMRPSGIKPIVNRIGEHDLLGFLRTCLTKNIAMGNISRTEAKTMSRDDIEALISMMANNWRKWELDKSYMSWIVAMFRKYTLTHLTRPINEGERKYRGGSLQNRDFMDDDLFNRRDPFMEGVGRGSRKESFMKDDNEVMNL